MRAPLNKPVVRKIGQGLLRIYAVFAILIVTAAIVLGACGKLDDPPPPQRVFQVELPESQEDLAAFRSLVAAGDTLVVLYAPAVKPCLDLLYNEDWTTLPNQDAVEAFLWDEPDCGLDRVAYYLSEIRVVSLVPRIEFYVPEGLRVDLAVRTWAVSFDDTAGSSSAWGPYFPDEPLRWADVVFDTRACIE